VVVLRKVTKRLLFDCDNYGSFTVFAVYLQFYVVLCGCTTAENRGLNHIKCERGITVGPIWAVLS